MNKYDLISAIAKDTGNTEQNAEKVVNSFLSNISNALARGERVQFYGFGSFEVRTLSARKGRNKITGTTVNYPESVYPSFKAGESLKRKVNEGDW